MANSQFAIRNSKSHFAFTMVEVLIVVAILALLVVILLGVSGAITTRKKTALTENCLNVLDAALTEFRDITGKYPVDDWGDIGGSLIAGATESDGPPEPNELLYLQLSILPQTRDIIAKLPNQLIVAPLSGATVTISGQVSPYLRSVVDAWGNALEYDDYNDPDRFPEIRSSGSDGDLDTEDDITNED